MATNEETSSAVPSKRSLEAIEPDTNDVRPDAKRIRPDEAGDKQATLAAAPPGTQSDHDRNIGSVVDQELSAATVTEISVPDTSASQSIEKSDRDLPGSEPAVEKNANALPTFQNALSVATPSPDLYDQCHVPFEAHVPSTAQEEKDTQPKTVRDSDIQPERNLTGEETMLAPALADEHADQAINPAAPNQRQGELSQPEEGHHEHQAAASDVGDLRNDAAQSARVVEACGSAGEPAAAATLSMADVVPPSEEDSDGQDELSTDERRPATRSKGRLKSAISQPQETEASHKEDIARIRRELAEQEADLKKREKSLAARDKAQKKRQGEQNVQDNSTRQVNVLQEKNRSLLRDLARRGAGNEQVSDDKLNDDMLHLSKPLANWTRTFYKDFRFGKWAISHLLYELYHSCKS